MTNQIKYHVLFVFEDLMTFAYLGTGQTILEQRKSAIGLYSDLLFSYLARRAKFKEVEKLHKISITVYCMNGQNLNVKILDKDSDLQDLIENWATEYMMLKQCNVELKNDPVKMYCQRLDENVLVLQENNELIYELDLKIRQNG